LETVFIELYLLRQIDNASGDINVVGDCSNTEKVLFLARIAKESSTPVTKDSILGRRTRTTRHV
jgi:hypothetical protein